MSMGESTRRRLEGAVRNAANGSAPAQYVGGWSGGVGGTWGKANTGRGFDNAAPARCAQSQLSPSSLRAKQLHLSCVPTLTSDRVHCSCHFAGQGRLHAGAT